MALNFSYTLSPDENASWTKFKDFAKKVSGQEIKINLDIAGGNTNVDPLKKIVENVDRSGKALTSKVELIQERLYNSLNNLTIKADKNLLEGILPIDEISKQIDSLANSGKSLNQIRTEASQIRIELQQWGQVLSNDKALLEGINDLQGNIGKKIDEISKKKNSKHITQLKQETDEWLKSEIEAIKKTKEFQAATEAQKSVFDKLTNSMEINAYSVEGLSKQKAQLNQQLKEQRQLFEDRYLDEARRKYDDLQGSIKNLVVRYVSLQAILHNMKNYFQDAVQYTMDLDNAYTDVAISMDVTRQEFNEWTKTARTIAQANGQTTTSLMEMVKIYATAGESIEAVQDKLAGTAMIQNITQWDAEQTTSAVNSILSQYKLLEKEINGVTGNVSNAITYLGDNLIGISNALEIDNVKGIQEMVSAIDTSGSIVESAGGTMEWYMGITGALGEAMNATGAEVGNAMKMIAARTLQQKQVIEDMGESVENFEIETANAEAALNDIGVSIRGQGGELRDLEDILGDVATKWNDLSDSTQQFIGEKLAGNNRRSYFTAMMENYARVLELQQAGLNSSGELMKANEIRVESLAGQINILKDKMLAFSDGLQPVIAGGVQLASTLMDLVNSFGAIPTTITLAGTSLLTFTDRGKQARDMMLTLGESHIKAIGNINTYIAKNKVKIEDMKNEIAVVQQTINQTLRDIEVRKSQGKSITNLVTDLKTEQAALRTTQIELAKTTIKTYALQTAMTMGLSVAISAVISLAGKLVSAFKEFNHGRTLEGITESIGSLNEKVNSYTDSVEKLNNVKADVSSMRKMVETINDENTSIEKQEELTNSVNEMLSGHASSYESIESVLNNENIALETRIGLLEQEAELQRQLKANEVMEEVGKTDLFGNTTFDNAMSQTENLANQLINAKKALDNKVSDIENGVVYSINGKASYIADASKEFTERVDSLVTDIKTSATNAGKIMNDYMTLRDAGRIDNAQFEALKQQYLNTIKELKQALAEVGKEDVEIFNLFGEEQLDKMEATVDKALQLKEKILSQFNETYVNPLSFEDTGDLDRVIDKYQELYEANESLIDILNEAKTVEFRDGHPFSRDFVDIIEADLSNLEDFEGALLTINELFEDMSASDLSEMFGEDLAKQIQEVLDIDMTTPFSEMSDAAQQAVEGVVGTFDTMENELKEMFYRLNATNEEFYQELQEKNGQVFDTLSERWGVSANEYSNVAEYKRAVDQQVYTELMQMDADTLNYLYQNTLKLLGIKEEAGEERVSMEDQAAFLINDIDLKELKAKLLNEKKVLEAKKAELEGELKAEESQANNSLKLQDDTSVKSLQMLNTLTQRAEAHYNTFYGRMSSTGALDGVAISALTGAAAVNTSSLAQGSVTAQALQGVNDKLSKIDGLISNLEAYEKLSSGDLTFTITPYNPSNSSTTSSGGYKPSSSGGSGSSGKGSGSSGKGSGSSGSTEKEVEDLDLKIDKYQELQEAINRVSEALERNQQAQEAVTTKAELKTLLEQELQLMEKKKKAIGDLQSALQSEQQALKARLEKSGLLFDGDELVGDKQYGTIAKRLQAAQDWANAASGAEKEWRKNDSLYLQEMINSYYDLMNQLGSVTSEYNEMTLAIRKAKKEQAELLKQVENLADRYLKFTMQANRLSSELSLNKRKQEYAVGEELLKLRERELEILKEQQQVNSGMITELKKEKDELAEFLKGDGFIIGADGTITNYDEKWQDKTDKYNGLAGYDAEDYKEHLDEVADAIDRYLEILNSELPDAEENYYDLLDAMKELEKQQEEYAKQLQEAMQLHDKLFTVTQKLTKLQNELAVINSKLEYASGEEKIDLLERQIELYEAQRNLLQEQQKIQQEKAESMRAELANSGLKFDSDGYISNYDTVIGALTKKIEAMEGGVARDEAIEELEELVSKIEEYVDLVGSEIPSTEQEWLDLSNTIKQAQREQLQIVQNVQESIANAITNKWQETTENLKKEIQKQKDLLNSQWSEEDWDDELSKAQDNLNKIQAQINNLSKDTSLAGQLKLEQLKEEYQQQLEAMNQMIKEHEREVANQMFEDEQNKLQEEMEDALTAKNLAQAVNNALSSGVVTIGDEIMSLNDLMVESIMEQESAYYALGEVMKSEMLDQLEEARSLWQDIGKLTAGVLGNTTTPVSGLTGRNVTSILDNNQSPLVTVEITGTMGEDITMSDVNQVAQKACDDLLVKITQLMG